MAMNRIQFQKGLSLPDFATSFGTELKCMRALELARWPNGFTCQCGNQSHYVVRQGVRRLYQCSACRHQTSLIAGTVMESTKLPLTSWFLAIYLISQAKNGIAALELKRLLGVSYPTAWLLHHKIMSTMTECDDAYTLEGKVLIDDAYLGGEHPGGKRGRGSENKVPFVAAVSLDNQEHPIFTKMVPITAFTLESVGLLAKAIFKPGACIYSDGLNCFPGVALAGCSHYPSVMSGRKPRDVPEFNWLNTVLGNLKTMMSGTHHAFKFIKYAKSYLGAFAYRFNRRFDMKAITPRLIVGIAQHKPRPLRVIRGKAEDAC